MFGIERFARDQRPDGVLQAEKERLAQREPGGDIQSVHREQARQLYLATMRGGVVVQAGGIGFEQGAGVGGQLGIFALRRAARVEQVIDVIDLRAVLPRNRAIAPARHGDHVLKREEIVLRVRNGDTVCDIGIGLAIDCGHAEFAADDLGFVTAARSGCYALFGEERFPCRQRHKGHRHQRKHRKPDAPEPFFHP